MCIYIYVCIYVSWTCICVYNMCIGCVYMCRNVCIINTYIYVHVYIYTLELAISTHLKNMLVKLDHCPK